MNDQAIDHDLPDNPDLAWELDDFAQAQRAMDFVLRFQHTLCVYSPSVSQIYTNYDMYFPTEWDKRLVILPDPNAFHDTFFNIDRSAIVATGLYIVPGELIGKSGLFLANVDENRSLGKRQIPFEAGLRTIIRRRAPDDPFLPILAKGDLREFEQAWPVIHMHRVKPKDVGDISDLDRSNLTNVVLEKLETLFRDLQNG